MTAKIETANEFLKKIAEPFEQEDVKFLITLFPKGSDGYPLKTFEWTQDVEIKDDAQYFYTLNPRKEIPINNKGKVTQGGKKTVAFANGLFADIDYGQTGHKKESGYETLEEVLQAVEAFELEPTYLYHTGHGVQVLYFFQEPLRIADITIEEYETLNRALQNRLGADTTPSLSHLLRLPGSWNLKEEPVPVEIMEENDAYHTLSDFQSALPAALAEEKTEKKREQKARDLQKVPIDKRRLSDRAKSLIMYLKDPRDVDNKDRSALVFRAVLELCRKGFSIEEIYTYVMIDGSEMAKYLYMSKRSEQAIQKEITRCYEKCQKLLAEKRKTAAKKAEIIGYNARHEIVYRKEGNILSVSISKLNADLLQLITGMRPDDDDQLNDLKEVIIEKCDARGLVYEDKVLKEGIWHHGSEFLLISKDSALLVGEDKSYKNFRKPTYHQKIVDHKNSTNWYDRELLVNLSPDVTLGTVFEQVLATTRRFNWKHPETADYAAAMAMLAPFQNALEFVPWCYISGASGTGKSTYIQDFFSNLYPGLLNHLGKTTAHAIAQEIGNTGQVPVLDEFEKSGRIPEILELAKIANLGGYKTSGTPGAYSFRYALKHMFWFASIYVSLHDEAQKNRALVFELDRVKKDQQEFHLPGKSELKRLGTKSVSVLLKRWKDIEERRKQVKNRYHPDLDARMKDTLMYPIALLELAEEELTGKTVTKTPPAFAYTTPEREEEKILDDILTSDIWIHTDTTSRTTVFEALMSFGMCKTALNDVGITRTKSGGKEYLAIHPPVVRRKLLNDMKEYTYNDVKEPLSRFEGAKKGNPTKIGKKTQKCVLIPWNTIETIYKIVEDGSGIRKKPFYKKIEKKES